MHILIALILAYHQSDHTATVQPLGTATALRVSVAYHVPWWQCIPNAYALVIMPDDTNPSLACLVAAYGAGQAPLDPVGKARPVKGRRRQGPQQRGAHRRRRAARARMTLFMHHNRSRLVFR